MTRADDRGSAWFCSSRSAWLGISHHRDHAMAISIVEICATRLIRSRLKQ
jgi:hypothetical protein